MSEVENIIIDNNMGTTKKRDIKVFDKQTNRSISIATANKRYTGNNKDRSVPNTKEVGFNPKLNKFVLSKRFQTKIEKKEVDEKLHISEKTKSIASNIKAKAKDAADKMKKSPDDDDLSYSEQSIGTVSHQNK